MSNHFKENLNELTCGWISLGARGVFSLSQALLHLPRSWSLSRLPLTCWHLLGASLSHSAGSSYSLLCDGIEKDDFLPLASVLLAGAECWGISWDAAEVL